MAWEFLNKTTYTDDLANTDKLFSDLLSGMQEETPEYEEAIPAVDDNELEEASSEEDIEEPVIHDVNPMFGFEEEEIDPSEALIMEYIMSSGNERAPAQQDSYSDVDTVHAQSDKVDLSWLRKKSDKVNLGGLNSKLSKYLLTLPEDMRQELIATSGNDQTHTKNSKHYHNNAIDLRFNERVYNYIKQDPNASKYEINVLDPNHGTAPHIHLETKQAGGTLYADDSTTLRRGLNDTRYNKAVLNLKGTNTIRGLDNGQPVAVTDGSKYKILYGPNDTEQFNNKVYEQKIYT